MTDKEILDINNEKDYMLTTIDNPYDPYEQFDYWYGFDVGKGYNSCAYLARIAITSDDLTEEENKRARHEAIEEIIRLSPTIYCKAFQKSKGPNQESSSDESN